MYITSISYILSQKTKKIIVIKQGVSKLKKPPLKSYKL